MRLGTPHRWLAALPLAALVATGCGSSASSDFDPSSFNALAQQALSAVDNSEAVQSLSGLGSKMAVAAPSMATSLLAATLPSTLTAGSGATEWLSDRADRLARMGPSLSVAAPAALFPSDFLGKTFVYDLDLNKYVVSTRSGAPDTGLRFILYAVTPLTHTIVSPLNEIGYLDVTDESTPSADAVQITAVVQNKTLLDYAASAQTTAQPISATVHASGTVTDGTTNVDFTLTQSFSSSTGSLSIDYGLELPEKGASVDFVATYSVSTGTAAVTLTIMNGDNTMIAAASGTTASISGDIKYNGEQVALISGSADVPTFTDTSGDPLPEGQVLALKGLFDFTDKVLSAFDDLLAPAHALLTPGVPL